MNKFTKTLVLSVAALATLASTIEFASAGDRYWRKHHRGHWRGNAVIAGVTAGVVVGGIIASRPRVVYREAPVVVEEEPIYRERETVYVDPEEDDYDRPVYRERAPIEEEYAIPDDDYSDGDVERYNERRYSEGDQSEGDDYFPDRPQRQSQRRDDTKRDYAYSGDLKPWTSAWRKYCSDRYQTFNPENGTYLGYDQKRHFCKAG